MGAVEGLALLSNLVSAVQLVSELAKSYDEVSAIIAKRISEGRKDWSSEEKNKIMNLLLDARATAIDEVGKLP